MWIISEVDSVLTWARGKFSMEKRAKKMGISHIRSIAHMDTEEEWASSTQVIAGTEIQTRLGGMQKHLSESLGASRSKENQEGEGNGGWEAIYETILTVQLKWELEISGDLKPQQRADWEEELGRIQWCKKWKWEKKKTLSSSMIKNSSWIRGILGVFNPCFKLSIPTLPGSGESTALGTIATENPYEAFEREKFSEMAKCFLNLAWKQVRSLHL